MQITEHSARKRGSRWWPTGRVLVVGAGLILIANSFLLYLSLSRLSEATAWVKHTLNARQMMGQAVAGLMTAEAVQRTYLITGDGADLLSYGAATDSTLTLISGIEAAVQDNPEQVARIASIRRLVNSRFSQLEAVFSERQNSDIQAVQTLLVQSNAGVTSSQIRSAFGQMSSVEDALLVERQEVHEQSQINSYISMAVFVGTTLVLIIFLFLFTRRELQNRQRSEEQIQSYAVHLDENVKVLETERNEIALINEMSNFLQSCNTLEEVGALAGSFFERLFPEHSGAFRVYAESRNQLTPVASWGDSEVHAIILPDDCWSLRRGQIHVHDPETGGPICAHCGEDHRANYTICVPLQGFGETLGLLSVERSATGLPEERAEATLRLADMVSRQLGLTLASLRLRKTLNEQSIRDPLTNAFNRRYLEVLATKEIAQAARHGRNLAILMLDVDHFKQFNDVHGHNAGDAALVGVVNFLHQSIREGDWLFRYGGEEFMLLLRDADAEEALLMAEELRQGIEQISVTVNGEVLPTVTASMGISLFPADATDFAQLVALADEALYAAKHQGRNCVRLVSRRNQPVLPEQQGLEPDAPMAIAG